MERQTFPFPIDTMAKLVYCPHLSNSHREKRMNLLRMRSIPTEKRTTANTNPPILRVW